MHVLVEGTGGASGWPEAGCRCASCLRTAVGGRTRKRSTVVIDGVVVLGVAGVQDGGEGDGGSTGAGGQAPGGDWAEAPGGYRVRELADAGGGRGGRGGELGGWEVTGPDGGRLLYPARPGAVPVPPDGAAAYDVAFLDMLGDPTQLGRLRREGLITADTITAVAFADHRVPGEGELRRRCGFWRVLTPADADRFTTARSDQKGFKEFPGTARAESWRVLVMGGARSGKSEEAELRLAGEPDVIYVATGPDGAGDPEWAARVAAHRARRPGWWRTAETTDLAAVLGSARGAVLIDGIGTWLAAVMDECGAWDGPAEGLEARV
jgi:adenosylcobinamide kinase/adenosylcobinamide-phosphate guanylyltransferase